MNKLEAVLTYHTNIRSCGVAKFNHLLAKRLGLPVYQLFSSDAAQVAHPLLSIKPSEFTAEDLLELDRWAQKHQDIGSFSLFFHDFRGSAIERELARLANVVYTGNEEIARALAVLRSDTVQLWAPAMLTDSKEHKSSEITVFSFGMAHKLQTFPYRRLRDLLEKTGRSYRLLVSTALHEGFSFDESFETAFRELEEIFPDKAYFLGVLSDSAVYNYLRESTFFAAFFPKGVRANNTTVHAAMESGAVVITNLDEHSPECYIHGTNILDISKLDSLPTDERIMEAIGNDALRVSHEFGWDAFTTRLIQAEAGHNEQVAATSQRRPKPKLTSV